MSLDVELTVALKTSSCRATTKYLKYDGHVHDMQILLCEKCMKRKARMFETLAEEDV